MFNFGIEGKYHHHNSYCFFEGYWLLHCHLTNHQNSGMNLVMQEGEIQDMPPTPPNFPMCNNFRFNSNHFFTLLRNHEKRLASKGEYKILS